jgi:hypothetical protein
MNLLIVVALLAANVLAAQNYQPITAQERLRYFGGTTFGPSAMLFSSSFSAGWRTLGNRPEEWGPHWEGFGKRYGSSVLNRTVINGAENSLGAIWKEDPRYFRLGQGPVRARLGQTMKQTFLSRYGDGQYRFGAAKAIGITGAAFAQKLWVPPSIASNSDCALRVGGGFAARFLSNLIREFSPDLIRKLKKK